MNASVLSVFFGVLLSAIGVDAPPGTAKNVETVANAGSETGTWVRPTECGSEGQSPCPALLRFAPRHEEPAGELEAACESGDAAACVAIAWQLLLGDEVEQDATRASDLFEATCEGEELGDACYGLGVCNLVGAGVSIDTHRAARLFERACEAGSFDGCAALGECAMRSVGMGRDIDRAGVLTRYACDNGSVMGCVDLAALLLGALDPESVVIAEDACARGAPGSCELLEVARMIGVGFEQDWETGFANLERMCLDGGYWACAGLAGMSFGGAVTSLEPGRGRRLMESGCELGEPRMCGLLAVFVYADGSEGDREYARELLEWSCGADAPDACGFAGSFIAEDDGDQLRAVEWYERGCDWGSPVSCNLLATWLFWEGAGEHRDEERAAVLFEMVCDFGLVRGCLAAEGMHQHGLGVPVDPPQGPAFRGSCVRPSRRGRLRSSRAAVPRSGWGLHGVASQPGAARLRSGIRGGLRDVLGAPRDNRRGLGGGHQTGVALV